MSPRRMFRSKAGWMSAAAVITVAGVLAGTMLANAAGPALPKRTPAQLLTAMQHAKLPAAFSAVTTENANLGFPSLPNIGGLSSSSLSAANWISGTHTVDIWYGGPRRVRVAVPVSFGETDLRVDGDQVWLWDSHGQTATHLLPPAAPAPTWVKIRSIRARAAGPGAARLALPRCLTRVRLVPIKPATRAKVTRTRMLIMRGGISKCVRAMRLRGVRVSVPSMPAVTPLTPQQVAGRLLAAIGPTTKVTVAGSTEVAGRSAYQLVIAPRTDQSLVGRIVIAVDSTTYLPLQLQVFARGMSAPAFQIGFTSLTFGQPASSNFTFTPPKGAHVKTAHLPGLLPGLGLGIGGTGGIRGIGPRFRAFPPGALRHLRKAGPPKRVHPGTQVPAPAGPRSGLGLSGLPGVGLPLISGVGTQMIGKGWLSVAVIQGGAPLAAITGSGWHTWVSGPGSAKPVPITRRQVPVVRPGQGPAQILALLRVLLNAAKPVHGSWGSGKLLSTSLFSVLITNKGTVLIGAVTPAVLYADAAKVK